MSFATTLIPCSCSSVIPIVLFFFHSDHVFAFDDKLENNGTKKLLDQDEKKNIDCDMPTLTDSKVMLSSAMWNCDVFLWQQDANWFDQTLKLSVKRFHLGKTSNCS